MHDPENALQGENISIKIAGKNDLKIVQHIAEKTWPVAYKAILSEHQMRFMLDEMYSLQALENQFQNGHKFLLASLQNEKIGFAAYELNYKNSQSTKLHKLYVLPEKQRKKAGKALLDEIIKTAEKSKQQSILLNVNRNNQAVNFYRQLGFEIIYQEDIDIGKGYFMNDFVMELKLT